MLRSRGSGKLRPTVPLSQIPAFPPIAIRMLHLLADEDVAVDRLVELFRADPVFSAEILRCANSVEFGLLQPVSSLQHALVVLGLDRVKQLAMTVAARMFLKDTLDLDEMRKLWVYSLACALLSEEIGRAAGLPQDLTYTAGLLHDVGRLALMVAYRRDYAFLMAEAGRKRAAGLSFDLPEEERRLFGIDHYEAGEMLAERWNLPAELQSLVGRHHSGARTRDDPLDLAGLVQAAAQLAYALGFGPLGGEQIVDFAEVLHSLPDRVRVRLPSDMTIFREEIRKKIEVLDIPTLGTPATAVHAVAEEEKKGQEAATPPELPAKPERAPLSGPLPSGVRYVMLFFAATVFFTLLMLWALMGLAPPG